jgi:hypothetical protein
LKTKSVTVGDLYPHATVLDASVWEKPISMIARTVARCDATQTPRKSDASAHAKSVLLLGNSRNSALDVAMPHGNNKWLLFQGHCSENNATGTAIAREVLRQYGLIEDGQNALPGALLSLVWPLMSFECGCNHCVRLIDFEVVSTRQ